ncbi:lysophospholipid acyltransferase family protein [Marinivivus vitaminiproducens]|uniref:lysophospholipid acyltransferase family protein n=1 Tax=Marinivivus vitaminiproducens TaxID=3035935 RepID=UPI00279F4F3D|nr:lysophospholipid acyltransferase family protein [Geminicoccaceae bacterium SCSIO 64248]
MIRIPGLRRPPAPRLSYAADKDSRRKRAFIALVERLTGQRRIIRIYNETRKVLGPDDDVWALAVQALGINVVYDGSHLARAPSEGPLVVVANHPFGMVDGLVLCHLIATVRPDLKVMAMSTLCRLPEIQRYVLPIDFSGTREAAAMSAQSRRAARRHLEAGGAVIVFPAGAVSTSLKPFQPAVDGAWHPFVGRLVQQARADVLPVRFQGQNSPMFQIASRLNPTLRLSLLMKEAADRIGTTVTANIGEVQPFDSLRHLGDPQALADHLRAVTYNIAVQPVLPRRRLRRRPQSAAAAAIRDRQFPY